MDREGTVSKSTCDIYCYIEKFIEQNIISSYVNAGNLLIIV